jgi:hypothetical protein
MLLHINYKYIYIYIYTSSVVAHYGTVYHSLNNAANFIII